MGKIRAFLAWRGQGNGRAAENNMSRPMEPGKQDVCGKENRLFITAASYITVGTISIDFAKGRMN